MNNVQLRWDYRSSKSRHKHGWIAIGEGPQLMWQVLQYRERLNPLEEGLHEPIWSEWIDVE